jgi:hypothetical protein
MMRLTPILLLVACTAPEASEMFTTLEVLAMDVDATAERFIDAADQANDTLHVELPSLQDATVAQALVDAYDRGVDVEVVLDIDHEADEGVALLTDANVPLQLADGDVSYFDFGINSRAAWTSEQVIMSAATLIADDTHIVNATSAGDLDAGMRVVFDVHSNDLGYDLNNEHIQLFGGADATSLTFFSSMQKSIADNRWLYPTQTDVMLEVWLGPQERLTKRIIDGVYGARSDIRVLTNDFSNEGLAKALQEKAEWGFDVEVIVGPAFKDSHSKYSRRLEDSTDDVDKFQVTEGAEVPTVVLIDFKKADDGLRHTSRAFVLSHDLYSAVRIDDSEQPDLVDDEEVIPGVTNDQLIDGNLWVLDDGSGGVSDELLLLETLYENHLDRAGELQ